MSAKFTVALLGPVAVGVKTTITVQLAPAATLVPQVLVSLKSDASVPPMVMLEKVTVALKMVTCTFWAALATPTPVLVKVKLPGDKIIEGCSGGCELLPPPHAIDSKTGKMVTAKARQALRHRSGLACLLRRSTSAFTVL